MTIPRRDPLCPQKYALRHLDLLKGKTRADRDP